MPIVVENLSHIYMKNSSLAVDAVTDINLTLNEGEFICVMGHTGSGKSTLIQHLNGLLMPTSGRVLVDGHDLSDKKQLIAGRELVGMVFQYPEHQLFEENVYKDIAFGPTNMGLSADEIDGRVRSAMELVGLPYEKFADASPFSLSGGEKRRVALAGIIAMNPKYLVLDEPMAGLDPAGRRGIKDVLITLKNTRNTCIIMVSHSMDDIAEVADRIIALNGGKLELVGTKAEVFADSGKLTGMGLELPQAAVVAQLLRQRGKDIPDGIYDMDGLMDHLKGRLKHV